MAKIILDGLNLTIEDVVNAARNHYEVAIDQKCMDKIATVREYMEREWMRDDAPAVYGFNTGLGKHKDHKVPLEESLEHQYRTVLSHCGGVGDPAPIEVVRAAMTVRLNAFCRGVSGLRPIVVERLLEMLNKDIVPVVPWQGSVGACGDWNPAGRSVFQRRAHAGERSAESGRDERDLPVTRKGRACAVKWNDALCGHGVLKHLRRGKAL